MHLCSVHIIERWLNNTKRNYIDGVTLYEKYGNNTTMLKLFRLNQSNFNQNKLVDALTAILEGIEQKTQPKAAKEQKQAQQNNTTTPVDVLKPFYDLKLSTFKKMAALHAMLCTIKGNSAKAIEERYKLQLEIIALDEINADCWAKIDYYNQHGQLPPTEDDFNPDNFTINELIRSERNLRSYYTKSKNATKEKLADADYAEAIKKQNDMMQRIALINRELESLPVLGEIKKALQHAK